MGETPLEENDHVTRESIEIETLASFYELSQLNSGPAHILQNSSSCIGLIFTNQPNFVTDSGVHPSLHPNCHHHVVFSKLSLKIKYSPVYEWLVWDSKNVD